MPVPAVGLCLPKGQGVQMGDPVSALQPVRSVWAGQDAEQGTQSPA